MVATTRDIMLTLITAAASRVAIDVALVLGPDFPGFFLPTVRHHRPSARRTGYGIGVRSGIGGGPESAEGSAPGSPSLAP
jgi:hypothetical protein